ncbi:MAG: hypothetical protein HQ541_20395 [Mariniphaga sp.]|nr:hypothetical protein [Mariniphaga sp.]
MFQTTVILGNQALNTKGDSIGSKIFTKTEINSGFRFFLNNGRESLNTGLSENTEERLNYNAYYNLFVNSWKFLGDRQESINLSIGVGPLYSTGETKRTTANTITRFENKIYGLSFFGDLNYSGRFYYDDKNYALVEASGFGRFEKIKINSKGSFIPADGSFIVAFPVEEKYLDNRLRYGVNAKAGVGFGKMNPVNHIMEAEFLLNEYYKGRLFSQNEINRFASVIAGIRNKRRLKESHSAESELKDVMDFLGKELLFQVPDSPEELWKYGEFMPRFSGKRFELGPLFKYYNREPDFIYGGFAKYEIHTYKNFNWNFNFSSELSYNRYKERDWFLWDTDMQFEYFKNLRTKYTFGVKYIPAVVVNDFKDIESIQHALIPYISFYHQLSDKYRMAFDFRYKITDENDFFIKGPGFSLAFYRSRY